MSRGVGLLAALFLFAMPPALGAQARGAGATPALMDSVPTDLRALLLPRHSEMRLVTLRYSQDRTLLSSNYAGNPQGRGGRPGTPVDTAAKPPLPVSAARIERLSRFDSAWQVALAGVKRSTLSAAGQKELDSLAAVVVANAQRNHDDQALLLTTIYRVPDAIPLVDLLEARLRLEDVNAESAARSVAALTDSIGVMRRRMTPGSPMGVISALDVQREIATVELLRSNLGEWFRFYNGYDPLFTWWLGVPYRKADVAMHAFALFLHDSVVPAPASSAVVGSVVIPPRTRALPKLPDVPDLAEVIGLPQDEMSEVVRQFIPRGGNGGGRGNGTPPPAQVRDSAFYRKWLGALQTLDFDKLTRNAQVDYLYIRGASENELARVGHPLQPNPPRVADKSGIPGAARGRDGLIRDLQDEFIPYTPEQLEVLAEREFAITEKEMLKASRQMGFGDDWKKAIEKVKNDHVPPGGQPGLVRDLIYQAIDYLRAGDLVTVPEVASESMHMTMMSAQAQLSNPFFLGGSQIQVAYPTDSMDFQAREEAMRGNNRAFAHATAFHEMIPGHNLSFYNDARFRGYRANLGISTPFYTEGWALYWELTLYDKGFDRTPEEKVGALFWRMHRCARIIFSLKFHLGEWSPQQAIDFLVDRVGHERDNATAEVRRSFQGGYSPLYQAAYLLGGLELRGLRHEIVDTHQMTERAFHDELLRQGGMPIALLRLGLTQQRLTRDMPLDWKFYGDLPDH